jgi:hypothetical protein
MIHMNMPSEPRWTSLRSDGALNARGYVTATVPPAPPIPVPEAERVVIVDPRRTATTPTSERPGGNPRAPEQRLLPEPSTGIELPDGRPLTKAQRVWVDPEVIARWKAEARQGGAGSEPSAPRG